MFGLGAIVSSVMKMITAAVEFLLKNPMVIVAIVCLIGGIWFGHRWGVSSMEDQYQELVTTMKKQVDDRNTKIAKIEADTKAVADKAERDLKAAAQQIGEVSAAYEERIAKMEKNPKIKTVIVPGAKTTEYVYVNPEGQVSCRRLPDEFTSTINEMVDAANDDAPKQEK